MALRRPTAALGGKMIAMPWYAKLGDWLADIIYRYRVALRERYPEVFHGIAPQRGHRNRDDYK
jgi:hypothetical protein